MTLKADLDEFTQKLLERVGDDVDDLFSGQIDRAREHGLPHKCLAAGSMAPKFSLPDIDGKIVALDDLLARGPVVLTFYRGGWCPYCNIQLRAYQAMVPELAKMGARLVAISPEKVENGVSTRENGQLEFDVLSDLGNEVARAYGLTFPVSSRVQEIFQRFDIDLERHNGTDGGELPIPATYVIAPDGEVVFGEAEADYRMRVEPDDILSAVRSVLNRA